MQVCAHCCKYIDPNYSVEREASGEGALPPSIQALQDEEDFLKERAQTLVISSEDGIENVVISDDVLAELEEVTEVKRAGQFKTIKSRNLLAVDALQQELDKEKAAAKFEEVKFATESEMDALLRN